MTARIRSLSFGLCLDVQRVPQVAELGRSQFLIGANDAVYKVDERSGQFDEMDFGTPFYQFVEVNTNRVIAAFETGVLSIGSDAQIQWRLDTDIITGFSHKDGLLRLTLLDDPPLTVDCETGSVAETDLTN